VIEGRRTFVPKQPRGLRKRHLWIPQILIVGADLLNLGQLSALRAPRGFDGRRGQFDGVFLTGVIAVLLASLVTG
jgi:hypothetical protein